MNVSVAVGYLDPGGEAVAVDHGPDGWDVKLGNLTFNGQLADLIDFFQVALSAIEEGQDEP